MVTVQYNPFTPEVRDNPYPMYQSLRTEDPVHWSPLTEFWVLSRYDDVVAVLRDNERYSADRRRARNRFAQQAARFEQEFGPFGRTQTMLGADPPLHTRLRRLVSKAFTPRMVENLRPRIQDVVDEMLDRAEKSGGMDVVRDLGYPLPVIVIAEMLGVPPQDRDQFKHWSDEVVLTLGGPFTPPDQWERAKKSVHELSDYLRRVIAERRREPKEDLLSGLISAEEQGQILSEDEMLATAMLLLIAGNETTTNLIGNGTMSLLRNPDEMARLRDDPSLVGGAIEELLRYDSPVQGTGRVVKEDLEIDGREVKEGQTVFCLLGAANRDPAKFAEPDRLDVTRNAADHVSFGEGIHFCLGAPLARAEAQIAFGTLLQRFPHFKPTTGDIQYSGSFILRGVKKLPISF